MKPQSLRRPARGFVQAITFPLIAAIAERIEDVAHQKPLGFRRHCGPTEQRREVHVSDFDHAILGINTHQRQGADGLSGAFIHDGEMERIAELFHAGYPGAERLYAVVRFAQ